LVAGEELFTELVFERFSEFGLGFFNYIIVELRIRHCFCGEDAVLRISGRRAETVR